MKRSRPTRCVRACLESPIIMMSISIASRKFLTLLCGTTAVVTVAGCARDNEIEVAGGVGITATRSACPAVAVPMHTGDITLFDPTNSRDASAIDIVATITNVTQQCNDQGEKVYQLASFDGEGDVASQRYVLYVFGLKP